MTSIHRSFIGVAALVTLSGISTAALADREDIRLLSETKISLIEAIQAAEKHQGGKAYEASIDDDSFSPAYEVGVIKDNSVYDIRVDAVTGKVLGAREDIDD